MAQIIDIVSLHFSKGKTVASNYGRPHAALFPAVLPLTAPKNAFMY